MIQSLENGHNKISGSVNCVLKNNFYMKLGELCPRYFYYNLAFRVILLSEIK